jgi:hypothetical protein
MTNWNRNPTGKGGFKKGQVANPNGRPHMLTAIAPKARKHAEAAIRTLVEIAEKGTPDSARVSAAVALLDRGFGRPAASVELDLTLHKSFETMSLEELQAFREKYALLALSAPLVIEHTEQPSPAEESAATSDNSTDDGEVS